MIFNDSKSTIEWDKKTNVITVVTENDMRLKAIKDAIISRMVKQSLDPSALDDGQGAICLGQYDPQGDQDQGRGFDKATASKIVKKIKDSGLRCRPPLWTTRCACRVKR